MAQPYDFGRNRKPPLTVFQVDEQITFNRVGKTIYAKGKDGTNVSSDTLEANLLFDILKALKKK